MSVVSLTWNSQRFVDAFLTSLLQDARASSLPIEVLVVDNGSQDDTLHLLAAHERAAPELQVIHLPENRGTTVSRNIALKRARGEYILIVDSDTRFEPGVLQGLVDAYRELPNPEQAGLLCPRLVYPDGAFQESARRFPTVMTKAFRLLSMEAPRRRNESISGVLRQERTPVDYAISAAWFFRRAVLEEVGYLDERIFYAPEDVEFCARLWRSGRPIWYCPSVTIIHDCQRLTKKRPLSKLGLKHVNGLLLYWAHYGFFRRPSQRWQQV